MKNLDLTEDLIRSIKLLDDQLSKRQIELDQKGYFLIRIDRSIRSKESRYCLFSFYCYQFIYIFSFKKFHNRINIKQNDLEF